MIVKNNPKVLALQYPTDSFTRHTPIDTATHVQAQ